MVHDSEQSTSTEHTSQFSKNRFFDGKLMTARDMQAEQRYHATRLETLTRQTTGSGIVHGLAVQSVESTDDTLAIAIEPGLAIDSLGRPIVVETSTTKSVPIPDSDEIYLFVRFDEVDLESVPVPDADSRSTETAANRLVEVFELTYRETPPDDEWPQVDLDVDTLGVDPSTVGDRIAAAYHDRNRTAVTNADTAVYLGGFERTPDGSWRQLETAPTPRYVYDNELLYTLCIEHIADTDNPHQTNAERDQTNSEPDPEALEGIHDRVDYLQSELAALKDRHETTATHLLHKTLSTTARLFEQAADRFVEHCPRASKTAREIAHRSTAASRTNGQTDDQFISLVRDLQALVVEFGEQLSGNAREATVDHYFSRVETLQSALEADEPAVEVAIALDAVAEAAADIAVLYPAHAE